MTLNEPSTLANSSTTRHEAKNVELVPLYSLGISMPISYEIKVKNYL
jgi:hypothetical protein